MGDEDRELRRTSASPASRDRTQTEYGHMTFGQMHDYWLSRHGHLYSPSEQAHLKRKWDSLFKAARHPGWRGWV